MYFPTVENDPKKIMKPTVKETDQSDLRLSNYAQSSHRMLSWKPQSRLVHPLRELVRSEQFQTCPVTVPD
jgi:hypothetical protein